jgi:hypothetical protein
MVPKKYNPLCFSTAILCVLNGYPRWPPSMILNSYFVCVKWIFKMATIPGQITKTIGKMFKKILQKVLN